MHGGVRTDRDPVLLAALGLRVAYGAALSLAPASVTKRWLGTGAGEGASGVALRGLGAREVALHGVGIAAALRSAPVRPLLAASIAGDLADIAATVRARQRLPSGAPAATAIVAGLSAALSVWLATRAAA